MKSENIDGYDEGTPIGHDIRNKDGDKRVSYRPDWSPSRPWASFKNGTAGRHFETKQQAVEWLNTK